MRYVNLLFWIPVIFFSCTGKINKELDFIVEVNPAVSSAVVTGSYSVLSGDKITDKGIVYSTNADPSLSDKLDRIYNAGPGSGEFSFALTDLIDNQTYYYKAFAVVEGYPYVGEEKSFKTQCPGLGCGPAGGYVIYSDGNGGGIECAPEDLDLTYIYGCQGIIMGTSDASVGAGYINTQNLLNNCSVNESAAVFSDQLEENGYSDWYLPSLGELQLMYDELGQYGLGKFQNIYHSSTEADETYSRVMDLESSIEYSVTKSSLFKVRPVRSF